jgi:hypothetical protein
MLRISCASSWFFFTQLHRDARSTEHKIKYLALTAVLLCKDVDFDSYLIMVSIGL